MYATKELEEHKIKSNQVPYLMLISSLNNPSQEELAKKLMVDKATVARTIHHLIDCGLVSKERSETDKRVYHLSLTEKGDTLRPFFITTMTHWFDKILIDLTEDEKASLSTMLTKITNRINDIRGDNEKI